MIYDEAFKETVLVTTVRDCISQILADAIEELLKNGCTVAEVKKYLDRASQAAAEVSEL